MADRPTRSGRRRVRDEVVRLQREEEEKSLAPGVSTVPALITPVAEILRPRQLFDVFEGPLSTEEELGVSGEPVETRPFTEQKERKEAPGQLEDIVLLSGISNRLDLLQRDNLEIPNVFSVATLKDAIANNIDDTGDLIDDTEEGSRRFATELSNAIAPGIISAQQSGDPVQLSRALGTISTAITDLSDFGEILSDNAKNVVAATDIVLERILPTKALEEAEDIKLDDEVNQIFGTDLDSLALTNVSVKTLREIRNSFDSDLVQRARTPVQLQELIQWVKTNVKNPRLQQVLQSDIDQRIVSTTALEDQTALPTTVIRQVSEEKVAVITRPIFSSLANTLNDRIRERQVEVSAAVTDSDRAKVFRTVLGDIAGLNEFFKTSKFRGEGTRVLHLAAPKTLDAALAVLQSVSQNVLGTPVTTYSYVPKLAEGMARDPNEIIREFQRSLALKHRPLPQSDVIHDAHTSISIGLIRIHSDLSTGHKEIIIPPHTKMEDIMKLAHALRSEPGTLLDVRMEEQYDITSATTVGSIVSYIQELYRVEGGKTLRLLYAPQNPVGGSMLGPLSALYQRPLLPARFETTLKDQYKRHLLGSTLSDYTHYGGKVKLSDVAGSTAAIATGIGALGGPLTAAIALPVAAISGIIGAIAKIFKK